MILRTVFYTFALVLACGPDKDSGGEASSTGETQTASTGASDPTQPTTDPTSPTVTGEASTGSDDGPGSTSISTSSTESVGSTGGDTEASGTTDGTTGELPPNACRGDADCFEENFEICFAPDESNCGPCQVPDMPCIADDTCEPGLVCAPFMAPCACNPGEGGCVPACDADSCGSEASCNAMTGKCEPVKCSEDGPTCPPLFACVPVRGGAECQRQACETDGDCGGAPCVEGRCHETFGVCEPPAP